MDNESVSKHLKHASLNSNIYNRAKRNWPTPVTYMKQIHVFGTCPKLVKSEIETF